MFHTVYIYNNDKLLIQQGRIYCDEYYIREREQGMILIVLSGALAYTIYGSYIIVI